jgi:hypothetical protein
MSDSENCRVSDKGVEQLLKMQQLTELRLGTATENTNGGINTSVKVGSKGVFNALKKMLRMGNTSEKAESDSNTFTKDGFIAILDIFATIPKLTILDMQLPHVKELRIVEMSTHVLFDLEIGHRGA